MSSTAEAAMSCGTTARNCAGRLRPQFHRRPSAVLSGRAPESATAAGDAYLRIVAHMHPFERAPHPATSASHTVTRTLASTAGCPPAGRLLRDAGPDRGRRGRACAVAQQESSRPPRPGECFATKALVPSRPPKRSPSRGCKRQEPVVRARAGFCIVVCDARSHALREQRWIGG